MPNPLRYGSTEWLSRLAPELKPIARLGRIVVARLSNGQLVKIIGGTPEAPTCMALQPHERIIIARTLGIMHQAPIGSELTRIGADTQKVTWVDWYNTSATLPQQEMFDSVTKKIDAAGKEGLPGGSQADIIDQYRFTYPSIYPALENYRDTGGRRALFATETKVYDDHPIAKPKPGGPIEMIGPNMVLHPGRFTYSDPAQSPIFKQWLDFVTKDRSVQVLRTQVSESALSSILSPYYTDYEFLVAKDVLWNPSIPGNPTWLPPDEDVQSYWGKPTGPAQPDWDALRRAGQWSLDFGKQITTLAVLLGVGYLLMKYATPSANAHGKAHA
jgi:hypothetical protein